MIEGSEQNIKRQLSQIKNLGPKTAEWLYDNGVESLQDIEDFGAVNLYLLLKSRGYKISKVAIYAFEGAIRNVHWNALSDEVKNQLNEELATSK